MTVSLSLFEVIEPLVADAVFVRLPASRSAWSIVSVAVQVTLSPGASGGVAGQASFVAWSSLTVKGPAMVTLPVFMTR